jgi:hypothetical protein
MYQFTNLDGTPVDKWTNLFLNSNIEERGGIPQEYDQLIHQLAAYFSRWNKEACAHCTEMNYSEIYYCTDWATLQNKKFAYSHGCCAHCAENNGYLGLCLWDRLPLLDGIKKRFHFNKTHGFFDESKYSCGLPRHLRSRTCLGYCCNYKKGRPTYDWVDRVCEMRGYS